MLPMDVLTSVLLMEGKLDKLRGEVLQGFPGQAKTRIDFAHGRAASREGGRDGRGDILGDVLHGFERVARRAGLGDNGVHAFIHFGEGGEARLRPRRQLEP